MTEVPGKSNDERRRRAIEKAAEVVPNAVLMTIQIIEAYERALKEDGDDA